MVVPRKKPIQRWYRHITRCRRLRRCIHAQRHHTTLLVLARHIDTRVVHLHTAAASQRPRHVGPYVHRKRRLVSRRRHTRERWARRKWHRHTQIDEHHETTHSHDAAVVHTQLALSIAVP